MRGAQRLLAFPTIIQRLKTGNYSYVIVFAIGALVGLEIPLLMRILKAALEFNQFENMDARQLRAG